jgi:23S rRNA (adenine2503-C2)-methyltransferase
MLGEILAANRALRDLTGDRGEKPERVSHVVLMGSGEPLDNYEQVIRFLGLLREEDGICLSLRNVSLSTCGLVPEMKRFAEENLPVTLCVSLHAPNDEIRRQTMPIANRYSIAQILDACHYYIEKTGRRVTFEYSLIRGVNDSSEEAKELAALTKGLLCHINLIPVNPIEERTYRQSENEAVSKFKNVLENCGRNVTIRREMGRDIQAACGQLRKTYIKEHEINP